VKRENLLLYVSVFGFLLAVSLLMMATGLLANALSLAIGGVVLFVLVLWLPLAWFTAGIAKRLDVLAETGNDWTPFKSENGKQPADARQKERA
jgi:hypothetical protein